MSLPALFAVTFAVTLAAFFVLWLVSLPLRNASIVDIFWGLGFVLIAWVTFVFSENVFLRQWLMAVLVTVWGLRLAAYLARRNIGHGEDKRYARMREKYGARFKWVSLGTVFSLQAVLMWAISIPVQVTIYNPAPTRFTIFDAIGLTLWLVGFFFEAVGDYQLSRFKADPANEGKVMNRGLWRYTRHPNYFGDCLVWWGYFAIALSLPARVWTIFSPILMTWLLVRFSGAALLERGLKRTKPAYADYIARTSAFIPMPPKSAPPDSSSS